MLPDEPAVEDLEDVNSSESDGNASAEETVSEDVFDDPGSEPDEDSSNESSDEESEESSDDDEYEEPSGDESDGDSEDRTSSSAPSRKKGAYVCGSCGKDIAGNAKDPVTHTSYGRLHYKCLQAVSTGKAPRVARSKPRLSDASIQNVAKAVKTAPKTPLKAEALPKVEKAEKAAPAPNKKLSHKAKLEEMKRRFEKMQALAGDDSSGDDDDV